MKKEILAIIRGIKKWRLFLLPKPFKVLTDNKVATAFVKQVLEMALICQNCIVGKPFYYNLMLFMSMFQKTIIFLQIILQKKQSILIMMTPDKIKELEDIIIDFNEYFETILVGLEHLDTGG